MKWVPGVMAVDVCTLSVWEHARTQQEVDVESSSKHDWKLLNLVFSQS